MAKAIFLDFYGTLVYENSEITMEVIEQVYNTGNAKDKMEAARFWWRSFAELRASSYGETFLPQYELAVQAFETTIQHYSSTADANKLADRLAEHWSNPPVYKDVEAFLSANRLPIYIVTNCDTIFVETALLNMGLQPNGLITSELAKAYKPRREIFELALEVSGVSADEVIHIGDSLSGDVTGAANAGIQPLFINRENKETPDGVTSIHSLTDIIKILHI